METGKYVAVVITSSRAFGLAEKSSSFTEVRLGIREALGAYQRHIDKVLSIIYCR